MKEKMRSFEFARKVVNGTLVKESNKEGLLGYVKAYPDAQLPEYQTQYAAAADFFCAEEITIPSIWSMTSPIVLANASTHLDDFNERMEKAGFKPTLVHTGIKSCMPEDEVLILSNRSSNPGKKGLVLANGIGVVDSDYYNSRNEDGEIMFAFYNFSGVDVKLEVGDRIGQGMFQKVQRPTVGLRVKNEVRKGGHGSTD